MMQGNIKTSDVRLKAYINLLFELLDIEKMIKLSHIVTIISDLDNFTTPFIEVINDNIYLTWPDDKMIVVFGYNEIGYLYEGEYGIATLEEVVVIING